MELYKYFLLIPLDIYSPISYDSFGVIDIKISTNTRYALRLLIQFSDIPQSTRSIAQKEGLSEKMLERICAKLTKSGLIESVRGYKGGHTLAKDAKDITLGDVLRLMETNYLPIHCIEDAEENCKVHDQCNLHCVWREFISKIDALADGVTLEYLKDIYNQPHNPGN